MWVLLDEQLDHRLKKLFNAKFLGNKEDKDIL